MALQNKYCTPMIAFGCGLNRSAQHFSLSVKTGAYWHETPTTHLLFARTKGRNLGSMAARRHGDIGRFFDRGHSSIFQVLSPSGGILSSLLTGRSNLSTPLSKRGAIKMPARHCVKACV